MKHALRVIVTIIVLAALGFGAWTLWFKPDPDQSTYLKLTEMDDYIEQLCLAEKMQTLSDANGHGTYVVTTQTKVEEYEFKNGKETEGTRKTVSDNTETTTFVNQMPFDYDAIRDSEYYEAGFNVDYSSIISVRDLIFAGNKTPKEDSSLIHLDDNFVSVTSDGNYNFYSYAVMEQFMNDAYMEYFAYAQMAKNVTASAQKTMISSISEYKDAVTKLNSSIQSVFNYQKTFNLKSTTNQTKTVTTKTVDSKHKQDTTVIVTKPCFIDDIDQAIYNELLDRYEVVVINYRSVLLCYSKLILNLKDFVQEFVFDGEIINELSAVKYDLMIRSINSAMSAYYNNNEAKQLAFGLLNETKPFIYEFVSENTNKITDYDLITNYNIIVNNYPEGLNKVMALSGAEKDAFALGGIDVTINYKQDYVPALKAILLSYGYGV